MAATSSEREVKQHGQGEETEVCTKEAECGYRQGAERKLGDAREWEKRARHK